PGLVLELVDDDLGALGVGHHLAGNGDLRQLVGRGGQLVTVDDQDGRQRHRGAGLALELLDLDDVTLDDLVLLAAGLDDRVHAQRAFPVSRLLLSGLHACRAPAGASRAVVVGAGWPRGPRSRRPARRAPQNPLQGSGRHPRIRPPRRPEQTTAPRPPDRWLPHAQPASDPGPVVTGIAGTVTGSPAGPAG